VRDREAAKAPSLRRAAEIVLELAGALDTLLDAPARGGLATAISIARETREDLDPEIRALERLLLRGTPCARRARTIR
jgi:hypothetical protein